jgi:hypothetical protein
VTIHVDATKKSKRSFATTTAPVKNYSSFRLSCVCVLRVLSQKSLLSLLTTEYTAGGIYNPDNKKRALEDISQMQKYSQAADIAVSKKNATNLSPVLDKILGLMDDFLDSLSDVPDEL